MEARAIAWRIYMDERIVDYIVDLVHATREPAESGLKDLVPLIEFGASPRAALALARASRAHAFLGGRAYVTPDDVKAIAPDVLRHRVLLDLRGRGRGAPERSTRCSRGVLTRGGGP